MNTIMDYIGSLTMLQFAFTCLITLCGTVIICFLLRCFWR